MNESLPIKATANVQKLFESCISLAEKYFGLAIRNGSNSFVIESMRNLQQLLFLRAFYKSVAGKDIRIFTRILIKNAGRIYSTDF